jgi:tripartite-type tricarboxylate transporter receptor subunit TctC
MSTMKHWIGTLSTSLVAALLLSLPPAAAELWPQRPVRVIVTVGAGVAPDVAARLFSERWKQPVVVENRPGANGLIGTAAFAAMRDDHVLLFSPAAPLSVYPFVYEKLGYDPARDLVPVARAAESFPAVSVTESLKIGSLREFVAMARLQPGKLDYRADPGAFPTLFAGFLNATGINMIEVFYREDNIVAQDLGEGRIQLMIGLLANVLPQVYAGKARVLAVTNKIRAPLVPDVPTAIEAGYPELTFEGLLGFFGPGNIPAERRERISADIREVAADPTLGDRLNALGQVARGSTPAEFAAAIDEQRAKMAAIAQSVGIRPTR